MGLTADQQAVADGERQRRVQAAQDRCAGRLAAAQSIGQSDGALQDLRLSLRRIESTSNEQLMEAATSSGK